MFKIIIPVPCHENWNDMTSAGQGRQCNACAKTVIDFTAMNDDEVRNFFIVKKEEKICGRFHQAQLHHPRVDLPENIFQLSMPWWKRFLVASLLAFGTTLFSCDTNIKGELKMQETTMAKSIKTSEKMDTVPAPVMLSDNTILGFIVPVIPQEIIMGKTLPLESEAIECTTLGAVVFSIPDFVETVAEDTLEVKPVLQDSIRADKQRAIKGDTIFIPSITKPDSLQKENPPKADSIKCEEISTIYS